VSRASSSMSTPAFSGAASPPAAGSPWSSSAASGSARSRWSGAAVSSQLECRPLAVAAIIVGWAFAQQPWILPGLTSGQAAAGQSTLLAVTVVVAISAIVSVPSRLLLFALHLRGRFEGGAAVRGLASTPAGVGHRRREPSRPAVASIVACLVLGQRAVGGAPVDQSLVGPGPAARCRRRCPRDSPGRQAVAGRADALVDERHGYGKLRRFTTNARSSSSSTFTSRPASS
jgi:hypothetical protein